MTLRLINVLFERSDPIFGLCLVLRPESELCTLIAVKCNHEAIRLALAFMLSDPALVEIKVKISCAFHFSIFCHKESKNTILYFQLALGPLCYAEERQKEARVLDQVFELAELFRSSLLITKYATNVVEQSLG